MQSCVVLLGMAVCVIGCSVCGGTDCGDLPGGNDNCCSHKIMVRDAIDLIFNGVIPLPPIVIKADDFFVFVFSHRLALGSAQRIRLRAISTSPISRNQALPRCGWAFRIERSLPFWFDRLPAPVGPTKLLKRSYFKKNKSPTSVQPF